MKIFTSKKTEDRAAKKRATFERLKEAIDSAENLLDLVICYEMIQSLCKEHHPDDIHMKPLVDLLRQKMSLIKIPKTNETNNA